MTIKSSNKQREAEEYVDEYISAFGRPPTYSEVAERFGVSVCAAHVRCRSFRDKMNSSNGSKVVVTMKFVVPVAKKPEFDMKVREINKIIQQ
mgnify:CR=1 FL=1